MIGKKYSRHGNGFSHNFGISGKSREWKEKKILWKYPEKKLKTWEYGKNCPKNSTSSESSTERFTTIQQNKLVVKISNQVPQCHGNEENCREKVIQQFSKFLNYQKKIQSKHQLTRALIRPWKQVFLPWSVFNRNARLFSTPGLARIPPEFNPQGQTTDFTSLSKFNARELQKVNSFRTVFHKLMENIKTRREFYQHEPLFISTLTTNRRA